MGSLSFLLLSTIAVLMVHEGVSATRWMCYIMCSDEDITGHACVDPAQKSKPPIVQLDKTNVDIKSIKYRRFQATLGGCTYLMHSINRTIYDCASWHIYYGGSDLKCSACPDEYCNGINGASTVTATVLLTPLLLWFT